MGWLRTDDGDPDIADVTAWLRAVIAWIGETALLAPSRRTVTATPEVPAHPAVPARPDESAAAPPVRRLVAVETAA